MFKLLDISEIKGSTHTIYWPTKRDWKSDLRNLQTRQKKAKKMYWKVGIELSIYGNTKIPQIYTLPQFLSMSEKNCGIYWLDSYNLLTSKNGLKSSKQLKIIFPFMSVLNTLQSKQCLCILTFPKCDAQFTDKIFTIYRAEKCLRWYKQYK